MAKDDTTPGGLFSKMVRFVRSPGTQWNDLDDPSSVKEGSLSKQALKEMIERKRRNDFVRKREFDMLRKLRRREASGATGGASDAAARPSFFQSSLPSRPDDRAMTLKKIDEIEAQMSMQWWKTKHGPGGAVSALNTSSDFPVSDLPSRPQAPGQQVRPVPPASAHAYARTAPDDLGGSFGLSPAKTPAIKQTQQPSVGAPHAPRVAAVQQPIPPAPAQVSLDDDNSLDFTGSFTPIAPLAKPVEPIAKHKPTGGVGNPAVKPPSAATASSQVKPPIAGLAAAYDGSGAASGFSASKLFAVEVDEVQHDPELEEAAIRFANGDDAGAEAGLMEAIGMSGVRHHHEETWLTLFDLYRATGQYDRFESMAIDFANKFARSSPMWFSLPEMVSKMSHAAPSAARDGKVDWKSPAVFGIQSLAALNGALAKASGTWTLDWTSIQSFEDNAVAPLIKLLSTWAVQPVKLCIAGTANLEKVLRESAPSGDRKVSHDRWHLLMAYLRVAHRPDEFELAALDFCVTYEVSPPSWDSAKCDFKSLDADGQSAANHTIIGETVHDSIISELHTEAGASTMAAQLASVELSGQITGEPKPVLDKLEARMSGADVMIISCAKLIRVDFSAAGSLLNWVTARQAEGRIVQFTDVNRLVAAFFHVIGISEHAKVGARAD